MMFTRILMTGAGGSVGCALRRHLAGAYELLRLGDIREQAAAGPGEELVELDVRDPASLDRAMAGIDCILHLAGVPGQKAWPEILAVNIEGTYNVFEAARRQGVRRVVYASSNHAVGFHRREKMLDSGVAPRPDSHYGAAKVFGEALGRLYADKYALSVACLRIGTFRTPDRPTEARQLSSWISHRDMAQLARRCIDHPGFHFLVAYGASRNTRGRWSNADVAFLQYEPQDDSEAFAQEILALNVPEDPIAAQFHGGFHCPIGFVGDTSRIE
ncbi:MAG: NAD-dependent epimerase/dehydratase family protein [Betaproteobacteria bacterium]